MWLCKRRIGLAKQEESNGGSTDSPVKEWIAPSLAAANVNSAS